MGGRIHCNLFLQDKPIVPGVKFSVTLIPSITEFHLISGKQDAAEKVVVTKIALKVRRINVTSAAILSIEKSLLNRTIDYPV